MTTTESRQAFTREVTDILQRYIIDGDLEVAVVALDEAAIFYTGHAPAWRRRYKDGVTECSIFRGMPGRLGMLLLTQGRVATLAPTGELLPDDADVGAAVFVEHVCSTPRPMTITATGITKVCVRYRRDDE